ncbi:MAG TPA: hypothetical protein VHL34_00950 [Rhizomicrobium sp.]|jgi:hypothetical protein|nr:hypothetical protein [Rhizomicrobium sp.]
MKMTKGNAASTKKPRYATEQDVKQLIDAIDRIRDDNSRYLICMMVDTITQHLVAQESFATEGIESTRSFAN